MRDPLYDYIAMPSPLAGLIDHPLVQRLRRVAQNSLTSSVYPSLTGSRFEHAIGAMHLAGLAFDSISENSPDALESLVTAASRDLTQPGDEWTRERVRFVLPSAVQAVALLHDVGHTPFSHALEDLYRERAPDIFGLRPSYEEVTRREGAPLHEIAGRLLFAQLESAFQDGDTYRLANAIYSASSRRDWAGALKRLIDGDVDLDRLDYLMRDARKAGTEFGRIDWRRLLGSLELHEPAQGEFEIQFGMRARSAVEGLLRSRVDAYRWIYLHSRAAGAALCLRRCVEMLMELAGSMGEVRTPADNRRLGAIYSRLIPPLNFIDPPLPTFSQVSDILGEGHDLDLSLEQAEESVSAVLRTDIQRGVDDGSVLEWIKRGVLLARFLLEASARSETDYYVERRDTLRRLVKYSGPVLNDDRHSLIAAWKTSDEYVDFCRLIMGSSELLRAVDTVSSTLREEYEFLGTETQEVVDQFLWEFRDGIYPENPVTQVSPFNFLLSWLGLDDLRRLADALDDTVGVAVAAESGCAGWIDIDRPTLRLSMSGLSDSGTALYQQNARRPLSDVSLVPKHLQEEDERAVRLFVFFVRSEGVIARKAAFRERLRALIAYEMPNLLVQPLLANLRAELDEGLYNGE